MRRHNPRILLIEPSEPRRARVGAVLFKAGFELDGVPTLADGLAFMREASPDGIVLALDAAPSPDEALRALRGRFGEAPVLLLADAPRVRLAVALLDGGVEDFVIHPVQDAELTTRLRKLLERHDLHSKVVFFQDELRKKARLEDIATRSPAMKAMVERVRRASPMRSTVLITGESGVGKELVARQVHLLSPRREQPFIALNCAAMPSSLIESELFGHEKGAFTGAHARVRGKFEIADGGTVFLDEIGEMERGTQAKLLRVLEQREFMRVGGARTIRVDVRLIAATNADLEKRVRQGVFRRDLYYRLKVVTLHVPPLRERREDIPSLVETFLDDLARANAVPAKTIAPDALDRLCRHSWPGNVRELKNVIESLLVSAAGDRIETGDLPPSLLGEVSRPLQRAPIAGLTMADMERELIRQTLEANGGNRTHSAEMLGIGVRTLQRKITAYDLDIPPKRRRPRKKIVHADDR